jgi:hypothetical protein
MSGALAWLQGHFTRSARLDMGFANHGGMWGDLLLLPIANAAIVPHVIGGWWVLVSLAICVLLSVWVHIHWYGGARAAGGRPSTIEGKYHSRGHMWPTRPSGWWWKDLSWSGWAHVAYVACELTVLIGFLMFPMPPETTAVVALIFSLHVPLGLLQPRWFLTGELAGLRKQPLLLPCLTVLWVACLMKIV